MSPEQASGETEIGVPGDIYGLACVFYEMLAGEPPFRGTSARATMAKQVTERPRPLRALRPDAPSGFERVLEKALAKDPSQRFATIVEFCGALDRAQVGAEPAVRDDDAHASPCCRSSTPARIPTTSISATESPTS